MTNDFEGKGREARFNAGLAKLERIDKIKRRIHVSRFEGDYSVLFNGLRSYFVELSELLTDNELSEAKKKMDRCGTLLSYRGSHVKISNRDLDNAFLEFELYMIKVENIHGLSMPEKPDEYEATMV